MTTRRQVTTSKRRRNVTCSATGCAPATRFALFNRLFGCEASLTGFICNVVRRRDEFDLERFGDQVCGFHLRGDGVWFRAIHKAEATVTRRSEGP